MEKELNAIKSVDYYYPILAKIAEDQDKSPIDVPITMGCSLLKKGYQATTKPFLTVNSSTIMAFFKGPDASRSMQQIIAFAGLSLLFFPMVCMASTPPVQPSLSFHVSDPSPGQDDSLIFSAAWNGYVSYNIPPDQVIVHVFFEPDGKRLGTFSLPRLDGECTLENTCVYQTSVKVEDFPSGTFMLIATDPLSGATDRQMISIPLHGKGNIGFFTKGEHDQIFLSSSVILGAFLVFVLALLVRQKS